MPMTEKDFDEFVEDILKPQLIKQETTTIMRETSLRWMVCRLLAVLKKHNPCNSWNCYGRCRRGADGSPEDRASKQNCHEMLEWTDVILDADIVLRAIQPVMELPQKGLSEELRQMMEKPDA